MRQRLGLRPPETCPENEFPLATRIGIIGQAVRRYWSGNWRASAADWRSKLVRAIHRKAQEYAITAPALRRERPSNSGSPRPRGRGSPAMGVLVSDPALGWQVQSLPILTSNLERFSAGTSGLTFSGGGKEHANDEVLRDGDRLRREGARPLPSRPVWPSGNCSAEGLFCTPYGTALELTDGGFKPSVVFHLRPKRWLPLPGGLD